MTIAELIDALAKKMQEIGPDTEVVFYDHVYGNRTPNADNWYAEDGKLVICD